MMLLHLSRNIRMRKTLQNSGGDVFFSLNTLFTGRGFVDDQ